MHLFSSKNSKLHFSNLIVLLSMDNKNRVLMVFVVYGQRKVRLDCFLDRQVDALNSFCEFLNMTYKLSRSKNKQLG